MTAAEAAVMESTSDSFSWSEEMTLASTCTSSGRPLGNNGRIGRSMRRETRVSRSDGRPISRRKKLPGIRPAAYMRSEYSTVSGKKPRSKSRGCEQTVTSTTVGLRSDAAGLKDDILAADGGGNPGGGFSETHGESFSLREGDSGNNIDPNVDPVRGNSFS